MVHISRHKSHRSHKHQDRSVSDDEDISNERKQKLEKDSVRISRSSDKGNRSSSSNHLALAGKGNVISDQGKKPKDIRDRWNGGGSEDIRVEKEAKGEISEAEFEKRSKGKSDSSSSKKRGDMSEKNEEKRVDKQRSRRESSSILHKDSKEKEKEREKEKAYAKEKEKIERSTKHEIEVTELPEEMHSPEQTKEIHRRYKRRDEYGDSKKVYDSRDGHSNRSYKDGRYKEKYRDEHDRVYRHYDDKRRRGEHSSRTHSEMSERRDKKMKLQCSNDGRNCYNDDHISKGKKRPSEETGDQTEVKNRNVKKPCDDMVKCRSCSKCDLSPDTVKTDHSYVEKADSSASSIRLKISPKIIYPAKDQYWDEPRQTVDVHQSPSVALERISELRSSEKAKQKGNIAKAKDTIGSDTSGAESDLTPQSDSLTSPNHLSEKLPHTNKRLTAERGQKSNNAATSNASNNIPPCPPINKFRSPSSLCSYEDGIRNQNNGNRRGMGTPWKSSGATKWPSPVAANCFLPIQHGPPLGFPHPAVPQFPSNIGPSMALSNTPYNNIHMHSYSMQMWDGNPNVFSEEPQVYGRREWDQNRLLLSNRVQKNSNDNTWNGPNGNMYLNRNVTQKETEYSHDERVKLEKQADGISKISLDASDSSKSSTEKTSELFKMSSVKKSSETKINSNVSYTHYYLSKLDISPDLAHPDVYKQCMFFKEGMDEKSTSLNLSMGQKKNNLDSFRPVAKSRQSLLIRPLDTIFQKAIFLFNKQTEGPNFYKKVEDSMDEDDKKIDNEDTDAISQATMQEVNSNIIEVDGHSEAEAKSQKTESSLNAADSSSGIVVCVEVSEKSNNIANLESVGVKIGRIHLSAESTH